MPGPLCWLLLRGQGHSAAWEEVHLTRGDSSSFFDWTANGFGLRGNGVLWPGGAGLDGTRRAAIKVPQFCLASDGPVLNTAHGDAHVFGASVL